jgi:hypothetical protein
MADEGDDSVTPAMIASQTGQGLGIAARCRVVMGTS